LIWSSSRRRTDERARTYGIDFSLAGQAWVDWMVDVFEACRRVCKGLVACVCEGQTRKFRWSAVPALLMADLHRAGFHLRRPGIFHRIGIPGSGEPDWLRADTEYIICTARPGKLPWSDNTACGHPPKWAPGGEISHRLSDGTRVNQWGHSVRKDVVNGRRVVRGTINGDTQTSDSYYPPVLANPGNVIRLKVGGGSMGSPLAHENEAPFPQQLAEFFVRSFCPPNGIVCDPFSGSGTTLAAALTHGRRFVGCDIRQLQVELTARRAATVQPVLFS